MAAGTVEDAAAVTSRPRNYGRWRAATLASVYLLMVVHVLHWKLSGRTLAPLELNEVMFTLELGIVTAGFLFMALAVVATAFFGRFFCSWGCHILALEDASAWILRKLRIKPRPLRSRVLLIVPPAALFYMFGWPQLKRLAVTLWPGTASALGSPPPFDLRIAGDAEGWASFVTTDFWRNLPGPWMTALTFLACGFAIVYFLGSRSFCTYGCPYGVLFGLMDRMAPGRIRLSGKCTQCATCTATCQSGIRVHEEVDRFGRVVSSKCLKDLDCVAACPEGALDYGRAKPSGWRSLFDPRRSRAKYDFTRAEEGILAVSFVVTLFVFRGLYAAVPFLLTLGFGSVVGFVAVMAWRLARRPTVRWRDTALRRAGKLTGAGRVFAAGAALLGLFTVHSGFIRYHEARGDAALAEAERTPPPASRPLEEAALSHLSAANRWGLFHPPSLEPKLASLFLSLGDLDDAARSLRRIAARSRRPEMRAGAHLRLGRLKAQSGDADGALEEYGQALAIDPALTDAHLEAADLLVAGGNRFDAEQHLRAALAQEPESLRALFNLAIVVGQRGERDEARELLERADRLAPGDPAVRRAQELLDTASR